MDETIFNFKFSDNTFIRSITPNIVLHIERLTYSVAVLHFTDELNQKINIPASIQIYVFDYQTNKKLVINPIKQVYTLCWTENYEIEFNEKNVLKLTNQRSWSIHSV
jgi:hypothetical protein